jgi:hypothetical protein
VERRAQEGDRRVNRIYLTPEAERVHKRIWRIAEVTVDDALANLSALEAAQLVRLLTRVKGNLVAVVDGATAPAARKSVHTTNLPPRARRAHRPNGRLAP